MWIKKLRVKLFEPWIKMTLEVNTQFEVNQNYLEISLYLTSTPPRDRFSGTKFIRVVFGIFLLTGKFD